MIEKDCYVVLQATAYIFNYLGEEVLCLLATKLRYFFVSSFCELIGHA